ncbi:hypothetical protein [Neogemmobacter tilapiae]|uniref:Lipoprotein n=1 Tax=Neogemmobacter tilapiae TaxID=875041 RepID=A0A918TV28_9RHOB|nr:hypothetical protein [Gemmobacter tilapiae]GHC63840.1 hypothetical protein GCM10007315_30300 [Gemmobacter tilapiae]
MITPRLLPLVALAFLAACGTPQEQCVARNTRDLRTVDKLIAEVQGNLARGYALRETTVTRPSWESCLRQTTNKKGKPVVVETLCLEDETTTVTKPEAIDPGAERRKLAGLQEQRQKLAGQAEAMVKACRAQYPE